MSDHAKTESEQFQKLHELIDGMHTAMLTTSEGTRMRSRPMAVIKNEGNVLWFFTGKDSDKAREIGGHSQVNVAFADESHNKFVSISGKAQVVNDPVKAREIWTVFAKGWFDGPEDPDLRMIRFEMDSDRVLGRPVEQDGLPLQPPAIRCHRQRGWHGRERGSRRQVGQALGWSHSEMNRWRGSNPAPPIALYNYRSIQPPSADPSSEGPSPGTANS